MFPITTNTHFANSFIKCNYNVDPELGSPSGHDTRIWMQKQAKYQ